MSFDAVSLRIVRREFLRTVGSACLLAAAGCAGPPAPTPAVKPTAPAAAPKPTAAPPKPSTKEKVSLRVATPIPFGDQAPYFVALEKGWFDEAGLDVELLDGQGSVVNMQLVGTGATTFAVGDGPTLAQAVGQGIPVKAVTSHWARTANCILYRGDVGITKPKDLEGKSVGYTAGSAPEVFWPAFVKATGIDVGKVRVITTDLAAKQTMLLRKDIEAVVNVYNVIPSLLQAGKDQKLEVKAFLYVDYGLNFVGFNLFTSEQVVKDRPNTVRALVAAALRGYKFARENPQQGAEIHRKYRNKDLQVLVEEFTILKPFLESSRAAGKPMGWQDKEDWQATLDTLLSYDVIKQKLTPEQCFTNEFLPSA